MDEIEDSFDNGGMDDSHGVAGSVLLKLKQSIEEKNEKKIASIMKKIISKKDMFYHQLIYNDMISILEDVKEYPSSGICELIIMICNYFSKDGQNIGYILAY